MKINKNIFQTLIVRGGVAVINMAIVFLTLNVLGADGRGKISLFLTDMMLVTMVINVLGSSAVSYYVSKTNIKPLIKTGAIWVVFVSLLMSFVLNVFHQEHLQKHLFTISVLLGLTTTNQMVLIGKEKIEKYNIVFVVDPLIKLGVLLLGFYILNIQSLGVFLWAMYASLMVSLILSSFFVFDIIKNDKREIVVKTKQVLKYGLGTELSSAIQFLNYRLFFYVVYYQLGSVQLGWFSVGVSITESVWIISRSITVNQYAQILNISDKIKQRIITNKSALLSFGLTFFACILLILVPENILSLIVKKDVTEIQKIIWWLCPGVLIIAVSNVWGHYFSGRGKYQINNLKSLFGFIVMIGTAYLLIPVYQLTGVVIAMLLGYLSSSFTLLVFYLRDSKT